MLCHVRVRDHDADETAQWFAPDDTNFEHGIASGVWLHPQSVRDTRTFLSTAEKPETAKKAAVTASKLAPRINLKAQQVIDTAENAWNPGLLELTVAGLPADGPQDPEAWAALTHQLRRAPDYRSTLALPLPLHLAKKLAQYVLPHDDSDFTAGDRLEDEDSAELESSNQTADDPDFPSTDDEIE
jgi:hypothetical protein